jgi:hypothetical protein
MLLLVFAGGSNVSSGNSSFKYVLIVSGQSNAVGRAYNPLADAAVAACAFTRTKIWVAGSWQVLNPPDHTQSHGQAINQHGIEPYLAYLFEQHFPNDSLYIIKFAEGGRGLAADAGKPDWSPASAELYTTLKNSYISPALASSDLDGGYIPLGFWWMQGESDAFFAQQADAYYTNLVGFFSSLAADIPETTNFKRYIGKIRDNKSWAYREKVRAAQMQYCKVPSNNATLIDTDYVDTNDSTHYSAQGFSKLADALFAAMIGFSK